MRKIFLALATLPLAIIGPVLNPSVSTAATPSITINSSPDKVAEGGYVYFRGEATGSYKRKEVRLQLKTDSGWKTVKTQTMDTRYYDMFTTPPAGKPVYRVAGTLLSGKTVTSPTVTITVTQCCTPGNLDEVRAMILKKTNNARANNGLPALVGMDELNTVSQDWTEHMAETGDFTHNPSYTDSYPTGWTAAGENIAKGQAPKDVVAAWMASPGHRSNILSPDYTHIGIGFAKDGNGRTYYTQNFAGY